MHTHKEELAALKTLTARSHFLEVQNSGKKWVSHGLILQVRDNQDQGKRMGFTVSKRVDKSAVVRNRIKRRLRAVAADVLSGYAQSNVDYVLVGRKLTETRPYEELCSDLKWCLRKMGYDQRSKPQG